MSKRKSLTLHFDNLEMKNAILDMYDQAGGQFRKYIQQSLKDLHQMDSEPEIKVDPTHDVIKFSRYTKDKGRVIALNKDKVPAFTRYTEIENNTSYVIYDEEGKLKIMFKRSGEADEPAGSFHNFSLLFSGLDIVPDPAISRKEREEKKKKEEEAEKAVKAVKEETPMKVTKKKTTKK